MPAELETMFYAADRGVPWHKAGTPTPGAVTSAEAIRLAGLDWEVELLPLLNAYGQEAEGYQGVTRSTDHRVLGVVRRSGSGRKGGRYVTIQNREVFAWMDGLIEDRVIEYDTAGALYSGSRIWLLARVPGDLKVADDQFEEYLLATTGHDGEHSLALYGTSVRVVCANTLAMATAQSAITRIRHARTARAEMEATRGLFNAAHGEQERFRLWLQKLATEKVAESDAANIRTGLLGPADADDLPTIRANSLERWDGILNEEVARNGLTGYTLANTVTGFADHGLRFKAEPGARFASVLEGRAAEFKRDGFLAIEELTGVKRKAVELVAV